MNKLSLSVKFRFGDFLILVLILFSSILLITRNTGKKNGVVKIQTDKSSYIYNLSENGIYTVEGLIGKTAVEIKDGKVRITDSACPNKTCIAQSWGTMLICLPNKVFVTVEDNQGEFDAIAE